MPRLPGRISKKSISPQRGHEMSNYPPGVTGNEYEIAGPDWEEEIECPKCEKETVRLYYGGSWWIDCEHCGYGESGYVEDDYIEDL